MYTCACLVPPPMSSSTLGSARLRAAAAATHRGPSPAVVVPNTFQRPHNRGIRCPLPRPPPTPLCCPPSPPLGFPRDLKMSASPSVWSSQEGGDTTKSDAKCEDAKKWKLGSKKKEQKQKNSFVRCFLETLPCFSLHSSICYLLSSMHATNKNINRSALSDQVNLLRTLWQN